MILTPSERWTSPFMIFKNTKIKLSFTLTKDFINKSYNVPSLIMILIYGIVHVFNMTAHIVIYQISDYRMHRKLQ
jgi:hypothetical protein